VTPEKFSFIFAGKAAQFYNLFVSLGLCFFLLKISEIIRPNRPSYKIASLLLLGLLPVYYKTFAFVRGEPTLVFFMLAATYQLLHILFVRREFRTIDTLALGGWLGLMILSRQWGFFFFPAVVIYIVILTLKEKPYSLSLLKMAVVSFIIAAVVGGWFYLVLQVKYGSLTAFNRTPIPFSFTNQPKDFYFGLGLDEVFDNPVRPAFPNQFIPTFYSETWGDYWGYFTITKLELFGKEPQRRSYLGRVNLVSLPASAILLAGFMLGSIYLFILVFTQFNRAHTQINGLALFPIIITISLIGYFWFQIRFPHIVDGETIKATYMLHIFPFLAMLGGELIERAREKNSYFYVLLLILLGLTILHNISVMLSRFPFLV
ncbi:MAG: hypothetical protein AB1489_32855, partial [Acidobacteriota bacterium]